jgi:uncharacterized protein (DUF2141 family)
MRPSSLVLVVPSLLFVLAGGAQGAELRVAVTGARSAAGQIGCALYRGEAEFPMDPTHAVQLWQPADPHGVLCRFDGLRPGSYAIAVSHDLNGNRRTDTNLLGLPTEDWGVSNNARPAWRAPRFAAAVVQVPEGAPTTIEVRFGR